MTRWHGALLLTLVSCAVLSCAARSEEATKGVTMTEDGIVEMWKAGKPRAGEPAMGFPIVKSAKHALVYRATRETGAYSHHCRLIHHGGRFVGMWSNHPHGEGAPGMRVLWATSKDGVAWAEWQELFPRPAPVKEFAALGVASSPGRWIVVGDRLFATCSLFATIGFAEADGVNAEVSPVKDKAHPSKAREVYTFLAREVRDDGTLGSIFALWDKMPPEFAYDVIPAVEYDAAEVRAVLAELVKAPDDIPSYAAQAVGDVRDFCRRHPERAPDADDVRIAIPDAPDGHRLCEPVTFRRDDGRLVMLARDTRLTHRMFMSVSGDDGRTWPAGLPTDIPDSPSRSTCLTLDDGTVLLIGNQVAPEFTDAGGRHLARDPLTVSISRDGRTFSGCAALRHGAPKMRIAGVGGRGRGFQYPGAVIHDGTLYVLYSVGKEDIACTRAPLSDVIANCGGAPQGVE